MRIAVVTMSFLPRVGGAEMCVHNLAQAWCAAGHDVRVINTVSAEPTDPEAQYSTRRYRVLRGALRFGHHRFPFLQHTTHQLAQLLGEFKPDFVSGHFGYPMALWLSQLGLDVPYLVTCHVSLSEMQRYGVETLLAESMNRCTGVVAMSTQLQDGLETMGVAAERILDIPIGVDLQRFQEPDPSFDLRRYFNLDEATQIVLTVGRSVREKAHDDGIQAFAHVAGALPQAHYVLVGKGTDRWVPLVRELGLESRVHFHDGLYGSQLVSAYRQSDVFLFPSIQELSPLAVVEAMACELPAVVTNISGSQDMIEDGKNGHIVAPGDTAAMGPALLEILQNSDTRQRMAQASEERAQRYCLKRVAEQYFERVGLVG